MKTALIDYLLPLIISVLTFALGYTYREMQYINEHADAESRCYSRGSVDAYVSKVGEGEFICFKEDINRKKISKSLIVLSE